MAAYHSLRLFFNENLPAKRTLQMWYGSVDGSPGITESAMDILREKAQSYLTKNDHRLHLTLMWDEMSIRKQLCWCNETKSFIGFSTVMNSTVNDEDEDFSQPKLAKDALVCMVVGPDFKVPVAYELLNGLESINRSALILNVVKCVEETGVVIVSLTGDGLAANITAYESLGVNFDDGKTYFRSPTYPEQKIYIILDPPHMLKLVRRHFSSNKIYYQNKLVNWRLLEAIVEKQSSDNFNLCNKLTNLHINWHQKPMNVRLAAETISKSVADTIAQLRKDGYDEFKDAEVTEKFLLFFNDGFDILNFATTRKSDGKFKQKLCKNTADGIFNFAANFKEFISQLEFRHKIKSGPILLSSVERGFFGFYIDFISLQGIYNDFMVNGPLEEFYPFQFSQDHLESFFSLIRYFTALNSVRLKIELIYFFILDNSRNSLGRNDNPNAGEFSSAFKKLLVCHPLLTSVDHNVITNATGMLTVSSNTKTQPLPPIVENQAEVLELELVYEDIMLCEIEAADPYKQHMYAYIALCVEEKFVEKTRSRKHKCNECANILLFGNDKINDELLALKDKEVGQIQQPSASTLKIIIFGNAVMKIYSEEFHSRNNINVMRNAIFKNIDINDLYTDADFSHLLHDEPGVLCHKEEFINLLIETYLTLKSHKICKKITDEEKGELIRFNKKRHYILAGQ